MKEIVFSDDVWNRNTSSGPIRAELCTLMLIVAVVGVCDAHFVMRRTSVLIDHHQDEKYQEIGP